MVNVCKTLFLNTLCVGERLVAVAVQKLKRSITGALSPDRRGRHVPANKLSEDVMTNIKNHIESFPIVDPHYCRRDSKKRYIEGTLNKTKLYELYQIWCRRRNMIPASKPVYERVLEELNIGFHQPKKDECWHVAFERLPAEERSAADQEKYDLHMRRKAAAESEKQKDKRSAISDTRVMTIAIDMEALLFSPLLLATPAYYARKFFSSNFTIFDTKTKAGFCYVWGEDEGRRGAQEVATCLQRFIDEEVPNSITHLNIYADNCPGQNKNSIVAVALGYVVQLHPSLQEINLKFLEPGHTYQEVDCIHSTVETAAKKELIYEPNDWLKIIRHAKKKGHPYVVTKMTHDDFNNFKQMKEKCLGSIKKFSDGSLIRWAEARWIKLKKNSKGSIFIKADYMDRTFKRIALKYFFPSSRPRRLYDTRLSISKAKYDDLIKLCERGVIPRRYHNFYRNLTHDEDLRDAPQEFDGVGRLPRR